MNDAPQGHSDADNPDDECLNLEGSRETFYPPDRLYIHEVLDSRKGVDLRFVSCQLNLHRVLQGTDSTCCAAPWQFLRRFVVDMYGCLAISEFLLSVLIGLFEIVSLGIIHSAIGQRCGIPVRMVAIPMIFMAKVGNEGEAEERFVNMSTGTILQRDQCLDLILWVS